MFKVIKLNIPNVLTISRIVLIPIAIYAYFYLSAWLFLILFFITATTDFLDGFLARKLNQVTKSGVVLDVVADKLFILSFFLILIFKYNIPIFIILLMASKDVVVIIGRLIFFQRFRGIKAITVLPATYLTKVTTTLQIMTIIAIMLPFYPLIFIAATILISLITAINYIINGYKLLYKKQIDFGNICFPITDSEFSYVDMHIHSKYSETDCRTKVSEIISVAKKLGIGVAITDHNQIDGAIEGIKIAEKENVLFIPGVEVHTANGTHVVFYFWEIEELIRFYKTIVLPNKVGDPFERIKLTFSELLKHKSEFKCLVSLPHPFVKAFVGLRTVREKDFWDKIDLIEGINGFIRREANKKSIATAKEKQIALIAGTDAHFSLEIGRSLTKARGRNINEFMQSLQSNKTEIIGSEINFFIVLILSTIKEMRYLLFCIKNQVLRARFKGMIATFLPYFCKNRKFEIPLYPKEKDK